MNVNPDGTVLSSFSTGFDNSFLTGFKNINGLHYIAIPAPGGVALLGFAGLVGKRRRR